MTTKELAKLEHDAKLLDGKFQAALTEMRKIQKRVNYFGVRLRNKQTKIDAEKIRREPKGVTNIALMLTGNPRSTPLYEERNRQLKELGLDSFGYYTETGENAIRISLTKGDKDKTLKQLNGLRLLVPHMTAHKDGAKHVEIFDHRLHEDGGWSLLIYKTKVALANRDRKRQEFKTLYDAMMYCQENHWYDSPQAADREERDEDDYDPDLDD